MSETKSVIMKKAREIGTLLTDLPEVQEYCDAESDYLNDPWIQEILRRQQQLELALLADNNDQAKGELEKQLAQLETALANNPRYTRYQTAKTRVNSLMNALVTVVSRPLTGEGPSKGSCSTTTTSSSGCSGCSAVPSFEIDD